MRYFLSSHPSVRLVACAVPGILAGLYLPTLPWVWLALSLVFCALTFLMLFVERRRPESKCLLPLSVIFYLSMVFSAFALHAFFLFSSVPVPSLLSWVGRDVILSGEVEGRPEFSATGAGMQLHVREVFEAGRSTPVDDRAKIFVRLSSPGMFKVQEGDFIRVKGRPGLIAPATNLGEYDPRQQNRLRKLYVQIFCPGPWGVLREPPPHRFSIFRSLIDPLRNYLAGSIDARFPAGREQQFVKSMILGDRDLLPEELYDAFRRTGTAHVIAVSGLHVALLAYAVNLLLQRLKVTTFGRWFSFVLFVLALATYCLVTGNAPSIQRAAIMSAMMIGGNTLGRKTWPLNSLAASDLVILLINPLDLFNPGFLMTNGAVVGILTLYGPLSKVVPTGKSMLRKLCSALWSSFCVSLSAMAGVSPVIALYFGTFSVAGIVANLPVVFFSNLAMFAALPLFLFHGVAGVPASLFGMCSWLFAKLTLFFTLLCSQMPMASIEVRPDMFDVMVFYVALAVALLALGRKAWGMGVIAVLVGMNLVLWHELLRPQPKPPSVVTVNLGKEMALLFSSGSETVLVDAGRRRGSWERVRRQVDAWGFPAPSAVVRFHSPDSIIGAVPVSRRLNAAGKSLALSSVFVTRLEEKTVRIDSRRHSMLLVSGMERLMNVQGQKTDLLVLWMYRFTGKQWLELDLWLKLCGPQRVLLVPGPFMTAAQKVLLQRFAAGRPGVEVRSKSAQTAWL